MQRGDGMGGVKEGLTTLQCVCKTDWIFKDDSPRKKFGTHCAFSVGRSHT